MSDKIKVLVKRAGEPPEVKEIENDLNSLQEIVRGDIEIPYSSALPEGVQLVCNEEGKLIDDCKPNIFGATATLFTAM